MNAPNAKSPLVMVRYRGLQSGCGITKSIPLFNVVAGPLELIGSTRTVESLEAEGYQIIESRISSEEKTLLSLPTGKTLNP
jgi:hypothetical protein